MTRERQYPQGLSETSVLLNTINTETRPDRRANSARNAVIHVIDKEYDLFSFVEVATTAVKFIRSTRREDRALGASMIHFLDALLNEQSILVRRMLPYGTNDDRALFEVMKRNAFTVNAVLTNETIQPTVLTQPFSSVAMVIRNIEAALRKEDTGPETALIIEGKATRESKKRVELDTKIAKRIELLKLANAAQSQEDNMRLLFLKEEALQLTLEEASIHHPEISSLFTHSLGGVTFEDLLTEVDTEQFREKLLTYLQNIPQGDYFWQQFIHIHFLSTFHGGVHELIEGKLSNQQFFENVFQFHMFIARALLVPVFDKDKKDPKQDKDIREVLKALDYQNIAGFAYTLASITALPTLHIRVYHPELSFTQAAEHTQILPNRELEAEKASDALSGAYTNYPTMNILYKNREQITAQLRTRLKGQKCAEFIQAYLEEFTTDTRQSHTDIIRSIVEYHIPLDELERMAEQMVTPEAKDMNFSLFENVEQRGEATILRWAEGTIPRQIGISHAEINPRPNNYFQISLTFSQEPLAINVVGLITEQGQLDDMYFINDPTQPQLARIFTYCMEAVFARYQETTGIVIPSQISIEGDLREPSTQETVTNSEEKTENDPSKGLSDPDEVAQMLEKLRKQLEQLKGEQHG